jgi:PBSX family phage terminase large subunit
MNAFQVLRSLTNSELSVRRIAAAVAPINIFEGAKRSGKTHSACIAFGLHVLRMREEHGSVRFLVASRTMDSVEASIVTTLQRVFGRASCSYKIGCMTLFDCVVDVVGANDERMATTIQGRTYAGGILDEVTVLPRNFYDMALAQMSIGGARLYCTCNPDSPYHWFKLHYIDQAGKHITSSHWKMDRLHNPSLSDEYISNMHKLWPVGSVFYRRNILGEWCVAEGLVYDNFDSERNIVRQVDLPCDMGGNVAPPERAILSIDYGTNNPFTAGLFYDYGDKLYLIDQYWYDSEESGRLKTDQQYFDAVVSWLDGRPVDAVIIDPSALSFITVLKQARWSVTRANNEVLAGVRTVANLFGTGELLIHERCTDALRELALYQWDSKKKSIGVDEPIKKHDHSPDMIRYAVMYARRNRSMSDDDYNDTVAGLPI